MIITGWLYCLFYASNDSAAIDVHQIFTYDGSASYGTDTL